jgi:stearoyl-CoA desaturase (Delta-9 desaturase)
MQPKTVAPVIATGRPLAVPVVSEVAKFSGEHLAFITPLIAIHLACALVFVVGTSSVATALFVFTSAIQLFAITMGYHRLLAHRSFKTSRQFQFVLALLGTLCGQNGPLWWVAHHIHHHRYADEEEDLHSPRAGVFWSHMGWLFSPRCVRTRYELVPHLARLPEMQLLQKYHYVVPGGYLLALYALGYIWQRGDPATGVTGAQLALWGSVLSTVTTYHIIWCIGSIAHLYGTRPFETRDDSRNNAILALLLWGDGWHNNHHYYPASARVGLRWWQIDANYAILKLLERCGIVWDLKVPPRARVLSEMRGRHIVTRSRTS